MDSDDDFEDFTKLVIEEKNYKICPECDVLCEEHGSELICPQCGCDRPWNYDFDFYSKSIEQGHSTSNNEYMSFTVIGKNVRDIRNCMKMCGHEYYKQSELAVRATLEEKMEHYIDTAMIADVIDRTMAKYRAIKLTDIVFRSQGKWYIVGACLNYSFIEAGIPKNRKEICHIVGITEKKLSNGENQLEKLNDMGIVNLPLDPARQQVFIENYLERLGIECSYSAFVVDIVNCAEAQFLHIKNESRPNSRCIGAIYMLCQCKKEFAHITKEVISKECDISKSTFQRYYKLIEKNMAYLASVFVKHGVPIKASLFNKIKNQPKHIFSASANSIYVNFGFDY